MRQQDQRGAFSDLVSMENRQNESRKFGSLLSDVNPNGKLRQSKKHKVIPDKFKQMTLRLTEAEAIKSPPNNKQLNSLDQSKVKTVSPVEEN